MNTIIEDIKAGNIYARIDSVSQSGLSRRILFYRIISDTFNEKSENVKYRIQNITCAIGEMSKTIKSGQYKQKDKIIAESGLLVRGCGMDMIFHTLYNCMPYEEAKEWHGRYNLI
jgi:hypothetical protein